MKAANLLPVDRRRTRRSSAGLLLTRRPFLTAAVAVAIVAASVLGLMARSASSSVMSRGAAVTRLDAQLAKLAPKPAEQPSDATSAAARLSAVTAATVSRQSWDGFLSSLSRVVPEDVWLLNLSGTLPAVATSTPPPAAAATVTAADGFTLTGYTYSQPSVARLMRRLSLLPWLDGVSLVTSTKAALGDHNVYQFTIGANLIKLPEVGS
jgi:Tfp pilus assembly protein PilN